MKEYKEVTKKEWKDSIIVIAIFIGIVTVSSVLFFTAYWYLWFIILGVSMVGIIALVVRQEGGVLFKCPVCGQEFEISALKSAFSPHGVTKKEDKWYEWKYLECPVCHGKNKMIPVSKKSDQDTYIYPK